MSSKTSDINSENTDETQDSTLTRHFLGPLNDTAQLQVNQLHELFDTDLTSVWHNASEVCAYQMTTTTDCVHAIHTTQP